MAGMGDHGVRTTERARTARSSDDVCDEGLRGVRVGRCPCRMAPVGAVGVEVEWWTAGFDTVSRRVGNKDVVAQAVSMARRRGTEGELRLATDEGPGLVEGTGQRRDRVTDRGGRGINFSRAAPPFVKGFFLPWNCSSGCYTIADLTCLAIRGFPCNLPWNCSSGCYTIDDLTCLAIHGFPCMLRGGGGGEERARDAGRARLASVWLASERFPYQYFSRRFNALCICAKFDVMERV
jgi:hypothetical protein